MPPCLYRRPRLLRGVRPKASPGREQETGAQADLGCACFPPFLALTNRLGINEKVHMEWVAACKPRLG